MLLAFLLPYLYRLRHLELDIFPDSKIANLVNKYFDLRPGAIIQNLNLRQPIYQQTAAYGHFGRLDIELPWEKTDKASALKKEAFL
ncbi:MAG: hypothetical protein CM1200mP37_4110 [Chloroflexota bacterium]|nr:MAG: hypothetical protein CM1200mP37_4110 [Chloroflexota bacterium]